MVRKITVILFTTLIFGCFSDLSDFSNTGETDNAIIVGEQQKLDDLLYASMRGEDFHDLKKALNLGANPNMRTTKGEADNRNSVLELAAVHSESKFLRELLQNGANPDFLNSYGTSPILIEAARHSRIDNVQLLIDSGANLNLTNPNNETPLHISIGVKNYDIAYVLIVNGADSHIKNEWGNTPADLIERYGDAGVVKGSLQHKWYQKVKSILLKNK